MVTRRPIPFGMDAIEREQTVIHLEERFVLDSSPVWPENLESGRMRPVGA